MLRSVPLRFWWKILPGSVSKVLLKRSIHCNLSRILFATLDKDLPIPTQPTPLTKVYSHDADILMEKLKKAKDMSRILELVSMHVDVMNDSHISTCFNLIHDKLREGQKSYLFGEQKLTRNETFQLLCNRAMNRARSFEPQEAITVIKTLSALGVGSNTYVMQAMLKMLRSHLNNLNLSELTFLNFLLLKQRPNPLVDGLKLALPLVLQIQIDHQLDSENLSEVVSSLKMACKARLKPATIEKVVATLQTKVSSFSPNNASNVIFALFSMDTPVDGYMQLLTAAFDIVSNNINALEKQTLIHIARACLKHFFYYSPFFLNLSKKAIAERWELSECYELIGHLHRLNFFSPDLLDLLSQQICADPDAIKVDPKFSILSVSEHYTFADYEVCNVHNIVDILSSAENKMSVFERSIPHLYFKLITCWAMLGCIREEWLSKVLDEQFLFSAWSLSKKYGRVVEFEKYVHALQWALENLDQNSTYSIPLNFMKRMIQSRDQKSSKPVEYPLTKFLENGLGGSQFFLSGVYTRNGHLVDHVLAMRSGNYPVSLDNTREKLNQGHAGYVEDIQLPEDAKIITIVVATKDQYCTDPAILKGLPALKIKNLSKMRYSPIVLNYENWLALPDREKIPYLMREIKLAVEAYDMSKLNCPS